MSFLQDIVSQATSQVTNNISGDKSAINTGVQTVVANAKNTIANTAANVVSNTVKSTAGAAITAVKDVVSGNVSGALSALNPANILGNALGGVGATSGLSLASPGYFASFSSSGGVNPGDALAGAQARADPLLSFLWYAQLPVITPISNLSTPSSGVSTIANIGNGILSSIASASSNVIGNALSSVMGGAVANPSVAQLPWYYVEEAICPFRRYSKMSIFREGRSRHYPSNYEIDSLTLRLYADVSNISITYLQAWNNAVLAPFSANNQAQLGGSWGKPSDYKLPIYVYLLDPSKNALCILEYIECWPETVDSFQLDSNTSNALSHHVTFSVGDVFINILSVPEDLTQAIVNNPVSNVLTGAINSGVQAVKNLASTGFSSISNSIGNALSSLF